MHIMNNFLKNYRLALTPLSPIHIGCGEDFEPTNYVIENNILYGFDPSRAGLNDLQKSKLQDAAMSGDWINVSCFFRDNAKLFKPYAYFMIPVSSGVEEQYKDKLGRIVNRDKNGKSIINKLELERTIFTGRENQPYIPGSSFKGAIRTAILDVLNDGKIPHDVKFKHNGEAQSTSVMEKRLLQGDFATSPLRLLKIADLMPTQDVARRVMFAVNRKKREVRSKDGLIQQPKGIAARKECILHGQYRAFVADAVLPLLNPHTDSKTTPAPALRPTDLRAIAKDSNTYHQQRLRRELSVLDGRGLVNPDWKRRIELLLTPSSALGKKLQNGDAFLIRLGRYGGADNKTLTGEGVASIKIMGAKGQPPTFESTTKTVWLAAETEDDQKHLLPFGWVVVEINPQEDLLELKNWCAEQTKGRTDIAKLRVQFAVERAKAELQKQTQAAEAAAKEAARLTELAAQAQRAAELATMTEQGKAIETFRQRCEDWKFKQQEPNIAKAGLFQDADKLSKIALSNADWSASDKKALADMLEEWLFKVVTPFGKEEKKKLKLSVLRDLSLK
ncbi:MAG: hypothetical protein RIR79_142 [Pseudomonadota bacterium]|jgi:CRISPR-associated protein Csm5